MTTFSAVLELAHTAGDAVKALEATASARVLSVFARHENGRTSYGELRVEVLRQAKSGFIAAGSIAVEHIADIAKGAGVPSFKATVLRTAPVLEQIQKDITTNFSVFRDSERGEVELRRLRFRTRLSVQAAIRRGFVENQIASAQFIRDAGYNLKKVWLANFVDNTPCADCLRLHGSEVSLETEFSHGGEKSAAVYWNLQGPPRHPNCACVILIYVENEYTSALVQQAPIVRDQNYMSSKDVRRLPRAVFIAVVATLRLIAGKLKGVLRGKQ